MHYVLKFQKGSKILPKDYQQFLDYSKTAPENRQPEEGWEYGDPNKYDHYGMWDALGKPKDFKEALKNNPGWTPDKNDGMYHGFSTNPNTGIWLKSHSPGKKESGNTAWMENLGFQLSGDKNWNPNKFNLVYDPEIKRMRYLEKKQKGGLLPEKVSYDEIQEDQTITGEEIYDIYTPYDDLIRKAAIRNNIPVSLYKELIRQESSNKQNSKSHVGAIGLSQITKGTAELYNLDYKRLKTDPEYNLNSGAKILADKFKDRRVKGNWKDAIGYYNSGNKWFNLKKRPAVLKESPNYFNAIFSTIDNLKKIDPQYVPVINPAAADKTNNMQYKKKINEKLQLVPKGQKGLSIGEKPAAMVSTEVANPKKSAQFIKDQFQPIAFKVAFAMARKAGNKTFKWNGKEYNTELASDKAPAVSVPDKPKGSINLPEVEIVAKSPIPNPIPKAKDTFVNDPSVFKKTNEKSEVSAEVYQWLQKEAMKKDFEKRSKESVEKAKLIMSNREKNKKAVSRQESIKNFKERKKTPLEIKRSQEEKAYQIVHKDKKFSK